MSSRGHYTTTDAGRAKAPWRLVEEIISLSVAGDWGAAVAEWELVHVYFTDPDEPGTCLCGHHPIREHCIIANRVNGNKATVGNCCLKRFLGLPSEPVFAGLRRVGADPYAALSPAAVGHAREAGWIDDWQHRFYLDTCRKRRLSPRQRAKRREVNKRVLACATAKGVARCH